MRVTKSHHVDEDEPDAAGQRSYIYRYTIFRFEAGDRAYVARSYDDEPHEAHFLSAEWAGRSARVTLRDHGETLFRDALRHLRLVEGKTRLRFLDADNRAVGYSDIAE